MTDTPSSKHPLYSSFLQDWTLMRDCYSGERVVKGKGATYLPPTGNQLKDGFGKINTPGQKAYDSYRQRARFPNFTRESVQMAIGMMHSQPAKFKLPKEMEKIKSSRGESLDQLLRRINTEQLLTGRIGLLAELPTRASIGEDIPYIATYSAEKIINWDDGSMSDTTPQNLQMVVFDETEQVRVDAFSWEAKTKYRVLGLGDLPAPDDGGVAPAGKFYKFGVFDDETGFVPMNLKAASFRGRNLEFIPFVFVNVCDLVTDPDNPPLLDLGNLCMTIYRGEADYRQNLFMQGQDTFVTIGGAFADDEELRTGAGTRVDMPMGGDAKYVGVNSSGLEAQRQALEDDRGRAGSMGAQTMDTVSRERESGASLSIRMAARTADMNQIALAGAKGLETILRMAAMWMGENPEEVIVEPNLEFDNSQLTGQTMVEQQTSRNLGYPISAKSLHQKAFDKGLTKMSFEEEMAQAEKEKGTIFGKVEAPAPGDLNPDNDPEKNKDPKDKQKEKTGGATK